MKVLIVDLMHESILGLLGKYGFEVTYAPKITREEIFEQISSYEGIIIRSKTPLDRELLERATRLQFIGRAGAGLDQLDLDYLEERGVALFHAAKGNRDAVAEHAIGGLLALFNHLNQADTQVKKGIWDREGNRGVELKGKTVGIFGFGNMGKAFSKRLKGFGVKVLAYDKYKKDFGKKGVQEVTWDTLKKEADVLTIHVPLTPETRDFFTIEELKSFAKPFWLINTARGEVIRMETLNQALDLGILKGAVLDVLENENLDELNGLQRKQLDFLISQPNVIVTPHIAGYSHEAFFKMSQVILQKLGI